MPLGPVHCVVSKLCQCRPPRGPSKGARMGAPSSLFVQHRRSWHCDSHGREPNALESLRSLLRKGLITPAELRRTLSRTAVVRPSPLVLAHRCLDLEEGGTHDPYQASPRPAGVSRRSRSESSGTWRHGAFARALASRCGETRALSHVPHRAGPETAPSHALAR